MASGPRLSRRRLLALPLLLAAAGTRSWPAAGQQTRLFRIGTGAVTGTYYPVGLLVAAAIGQPPGARACERGGNCGVPGLLAVVQSSNGSVANIEAMLAGELEGGFVQADVAFWAFHREGPFAGRQPARELRAICRLFLESLHLVVRRESGIQAVRDLRRHRVAVGERGSGTLVDARLVLAAYGLSERDIEPFFVGADDAVQRMSRAEIDAFFLVAGYPASPVNEAIRGADARLLPLRGREAAALIRRWPFFTYDLIPFATYPGQPAIETIGVSALFLVHERLESDLVYAITSALFHPVSRQLLRGGHPRARDISAEDALDGVSIPLHPGAERWYHEQGLLP
ncbi:hypothetical protein HRbin40_00064 [bacterium HR40]|nr:hypothetical protein HRbin40_00064 [bacterium HR40]